MTNPQTHLIADLSYAEWEAELSFTSTRIAPYTMDTPDGRAINPAVCPGLLAQRYDALIGHGLERGWLTLDSDGHPTRDDA